MRVIEVSTERRRNERAGRGNVKNPRKPADQWHRPARFPHAKIRELLSVVTMRPQNVGNGSPCCSLVSGRNVLSFLRLYGGLRVVKVKEWVERVTWSVWYSHTADATLVSMSVMRSPPLDDTQRDRSTSSLVYGCNTTRNAWSCWRMEVMTASKVFGRRWGDGSVECRFPGGAKENTGFRGVYWDLGIVVYEIRFTLHTFCAKLRIQFNMAATSSDAQSTTTEHAFISRRYYILSRPNGYDGNTARLARRGDEALGVRVSVAPIAPSLLDLGRGVPTVSIPLVMLCGDLKRHQGRSSTCRIHSVWCWTTRSNEIGGYNVGNGGIQTSYDLLKKNLPQLAQLIHQIRCICRLPRCRPTWSETSSMGETSGDLAGQGSMLTSRSLAKDTSHRDRDFKPSIILMKNTFVKLHQKVNSTWSQNSLDVSLRHQGPFNPRQWCLGFVGNGTPYHDVSRWCGVPLYNKSVCTATISRSAQDSNTTVSRQNRDSSLSNTRRQSASCHAARSRKVTHARLCSRRNGRRHKERRDNRYRSKSHLHCKKKVQNYTYNLLTRSDVCGVLTACHTMKRSSLQVVRRGRLELFLDGYACPPAPMRPTPTHDAGKTDLVASIAPIRPTCLSEPDDAASLKLIELGKG
ncbi:hypothetical protein PR048_002658 [Dryococelus australis]|uniref:Uncharacterized protein n=1 Tax=Dryococelus australis TaxID=614101 RepID=A0ABQ9IKX7_9NEOP|nr:hypothetical protein PR048_002658 [Dryococelus australis]